jgi:hypothetical protein
MDDSKFNLWRASFSFCFVDGFLSKEEQDHIEEKLNLLKFTDQQKKILLQDLVSPPNMDSILPLITRPSDKGFIVNHIRILAKLDNDLSAAEKEKIEKVREMVLSKLDMPGINKIIEEDEKASYHEDEVYKVHNKHSYFEKVLRSLQRTMNPGDNKFSKK